MTNEINFLNNITNDVSLNPALKSVFNPTSFLIRGIASLIIIIAFIFIIRKFLMSKRFINRSNNFRFIDFYTLEPGKNLYLIEVCNKFLVIGTTEKGLTNITEITDPDIISRLKMESITNSNNFNDLFNSYIEKNNRINQLEELKKQIERLNK